jgi:hypothetical protein
MCIIADTHDIHHCNDESCIELSTKTVVHTFQASQDACDYQNKRAARSCNEVKECMKVHSNMLEQVKSRTPDYIGKRHTMRLCSDSYSKGFVRLLQHCR